MAECLNFNYDIINVIKTLTEEISLLRSEVRLLHDSLSSSNKEEKAPEVQECLTLEQLSEYIPGNPAIPTLRRWIKKEGLPSQKIKRKLIFKKSEIDEWLIKRTGSSVLEIDKQVMESLKSFERNPTPRWRRKKSVS